jgi:hypothetical protein
VVSGVEEDMLITMEAHHTDGMIVGVWPNNTACTRVVSMKKKSPGDNFSCPNSVYT